MGMGLSEFDKASMAEDVRDIISDSITYIDIYTPKDIVDQPSYSAIMHEIADPDDTQQDTQLGVPVDKIEIIKLTPDGRREVASTCMLHIPRSYVVDGVINQVSISPNSWYMIGTYKWETVTIRTDLIGEYNVEVKRVVG